MYLWKNLVTFQGRGSTYRDNSKSNGEICKNVSRDHLKTIRGCSWELQDSSFPVVSGDARQIKCTISTTFGASIHFDQTSPKWVVKVAFNPNRIGHAVL